jgi:hypothetical protein
MTVYMVERNLKGIAMSELAAAIGSTTPYLWNYTPLSPIWVTTSIFVKTIVSRLTFKSGGVTAYSQRTGGFTNRQRRKG